VLNINQGASGCQEGNAIEVRNAPFDGTHPATKNVEVAHNQIAAYQKTGIVANGDVSVDIQHNQVGSSATQKNLAANSIQLGFGAIGTVMHNNVGGNQWLGASDYVATAILIYAADGANVSKNNISGNSDVGIYIYGNNGTFDNNRVFDEGADGPHGDWGIGNWADGNTVTNNKVRGFDVPYDGVTGGKNKVIPGPQSHD
jgi:parallel beta-helix repeat protein